MHIFLGVFYRNPPARGGCSLRAPGAGSSRPGKGRDGNVPPGSGTPLGNPSVEGTREVTKYPSADPTAAGQTLITIISVVIVVINSDTAGTRC